MDNNEVKKAYDILADEKFSIDSTVEKIENKKESETEELQLASTIYSFLTSYKKTPSFQDKEDVRKQLRFSIQREKRRKTLARWAVAASFLIVTFSVWQVQHTSQNTDFNNMVETLQLSQPDSATQLILQDGRQVLIAEEESNILYDEKGENITIDSTQKITQLVAEKKPVFNTLVVPYGKRTHITLADGSKVWLNSGSKLIYPATNTGNKREVYIDGEAIFDVTHMDEKPFYVKTKDFEIKVLGTVFNVNAYEDDKNSGAVLAEGKIEISPNNNTLFRNEKRTILPGTRIVYNNDKGTFEESQVNVKNYLSWREGYLVLEQEPLENILKKISRYYNVNIELQSPANGQETFSGNLNLKNTAEEVLEIIAETTQITINKENNNLIMNLN
ncbi:FecR domain-containing protein [uncultured Draconibacterium sp.]|uniref:FecR family protein n=1 Tax=uncultured Draconibacterium sp. TaxID=1573823 RepID=UPI0029C85AF2|nr:FecR domain-containing protein [uncultured Draconibacterium sp.]